MARTNNLTDFLSDVADAIRTKKGTSETILASDFDTEIENLPSGGGKYAPRAITFLNYKGNELNNELSNLDISNMTSFFQMFYGCENLTSLDLSQYNWDTSNITLFTSMFHNCKMVTSINISNFTSANVTNMYGMFNYCQALRHIDMRNMTFDNVTNYNTMFTNSAIPNDCEIIVKSQTEKTWITDKFPFLTNVKTVAEYEAEQNA